MFDIHNATTDANVEKQTFDRDHHVAYCDFLNGVIATETQSAAQCSAEIERYQAQADQYLHVRARLEGAQARRKRHLDAAEGARTALCWANEFAMAY